MFFKDKAADEAETTEDAPAVEPVQQEWLSPDPTDPMVAVRERHAAAREAGDDAA